MNMIGFVKTTMITGIVLLVLLGCESRKGPVESAGESVDKAVEKMGDQMEKAGDAVKDATN